MIVALSRFRVANGLEAQVADAFLNRPHLVDMSPGFLGLETFTAVEDTTVFYLVTRWTDQPSFQAWHHSVAHHASHRGIPKGLKLDASFTQVVVLERLASSAQARILSELAADAAPFLAQYLAQTQALYVISADLTGRIRGCSQAVASRLLQSAAALVGQSLWPLLTAPDAATLQQRVRDRRRAPADRLLLNLVDARNYPYTLECALDIQPDGFLLVGEVPARQEQATMEQLFQLHNELATLTRENERKNRALVRANTLLQREVHERGIAQEALRQHAALLDLAHDAILVRDVESDEIRFWNPGAEALYGWTSAEALGQVSYTLLRTEFPQPPAEIIARVLETGRWDGDLVHRTRAGQPLVVASRWAVQHDETGVPLAILEINTDITARRAAEEQVRQQALHDPLTGLPNRALVLSRLGEALTRIRLERTTMAVCLLDLDGFKGVNDTYGHQVGDAVLVEVSNRLREVVRTTDTVARLGGDEFALLLLGCDTAGAVQIAKKIGAAVAAPILVGSQTVQVGSSLGIALVPEHGEDIPTLLRGADVAMYHAKRERYGYSVAVPPGMVTGTIPSPAANSALSAR